MRTQDTIGISEQALQGGFRYVETPEEMEAMHPLKQKAALQIVENQQTVIDIAKGDDPRLMVWPRPCSLDDSVQPDGTFSALEFVNKIHELSQDSRVNKALVLGTGFYAAKPRTGGNKDDFRGLDQRNPAMAHRLITEAANIGVPLRTEVMNGMHIARYGNRQTALQVGARDIGSTMLRANLSATSSPIFAKNAESGDLSPALRAMQTINTSHSGVEIVMGDGRSAQLRSKSPGNPHTFLSYRGGDDVRSPESYEIRVKEIAERGEAYELDNSHAVAAAHDTNGNKSVEGQIEAFEHNLRLAYSTGSLATRPVSFMFESYLLEGNDTSEQTPGMSWTDPCIGIDQTGEMILELARVHGRLIDRA